MSDDEPQWKLSRPGAGAEEMFKDDPFMLEGVRKLRAEPDPISKPWWWIALMLLTGAALAAGATLGMIAAGFPFHPLVPLSGLTGGCAVFISIVGFRPGSYRVTETDERLTLWKPAGGWIRLAFLAGGLAFAAIGPLLVVLDPARTPPTPAHRAAPKKR